MMTVTLHKDKAMNIGTRSILFGGHLWFLHPWFVAAGWYRLYGFRRVFDPCSRLTLSLWDPRLWLAFLVHDLGYIGKPNMDGEEGELHPELGAKIMHALFDWPRVLLLTNAWDGEAGIKWRENTSWYDFARYHSRFLAKRDGRRYSLLCVADKMAIALTPAWLYLPLVRLSGEIHEYRKLARNEARYQGQHAETEAKWYAAVQEYCRNWSWNHMDGKDDTWTPETRKALNEDGVWV